MQSNLGVLLIAINGWGNGFYYQLAYNMALSLKANNKGLPVTVLSDDGIKKYLTDTQLSAIDKIIIANEDDYMEDYILNPFKLKTKIYNYTPYNTTLYLDCDGLYTSENSITTLFQTLENTEFQIHEVNRYDLASSNQSGMIWTKTGKDNHFSTLWQAYELTPETIYPEYNSSFIYFKKTQANEKYFKAVEASYNDRRVEWKALGKSYPDEMAWNITSAKLKHYSGIEKFKPCYFEWEHSNTDLQYIRDNSWFMMLASGYQVSKMVQYYNNIVKSLRLNNNDSQHFTFEMLNKIYFRK